MSSYQLILAYLLAMMGGLTALAVYAEMRRRRFEPTQSQDKVFRCRRCAYVYTDDPDVDRSRCSQCGQMNEPIQF